LSTAKSIGSNNIIIGTGISLPTAYANGINIAGLIFGSGSTFNTTTTVVSGSANGRIGINQPFPQYSLDVSGSGNYTGNLILTGSFTASLASGYAWVGGAGNITTLIATSSFGGGAAGLKTKSGGVANTTFTGNPKKATVTFSAAFTDTNYGVTITGEDARSWTIESKIAGSFVINSNANTSLSGTTYWHAIAYGETT